MKKTPYFIQQLPLLALLCGACQGGLKDAPKTAASEPNIAPNTPTLSAIRNGFAYLSNADSIPIPHDSDPAYMVVYAVRHCEKAQDGSKNPELSDLGKARALHLGKIMDVARIDKICSTNTKRTIETGKAVALAAGDPTWETFPAEAQNDWLQELYKGGGGRKFFYVGHTNTVPALLNAMTGKNNYGEIPDNDFGRFYIAITKGIGQTEVMELRY